MIRCISVFFLRTPSYLTEMDSARAKKEKNWFQILFQIEAEYEKILLYFDIFGGIMAQWLAYFLPNPVAPGSVLPAFPKLFWEEKNVIVPEVNLC